MLKSTSYEYGRDYQLTQAKKYRERNKPFDWIGDMQNLWIVSAMYDLMGKYLRLPVWKLFGPKVRSWKSSSPFSSPMTRA